MTIKPDLTVPIPETIGSLHFVGVGGAGMSGIARMFLGSGVRVSGSDRSENAQTTQLRDLGAAISIGHDAANVGDVDAIVVTSALWPDNPELLEARHRGIPVLHRSQALKALTRDTRLVAVAGAHGKTTSTGMIATALIELGLDPSFVNGGVIEQYGVGSRAGSGEVFVVEADESDGSFLSYDTAVALITNVDPDHLDHYGSRGAFDDAFVQFAAAASEVAVIGADDAGARRVTERLAGSNPEVRVRTFGEHPDADIRISDVTTDGPVACIVHVERRDLPLQLQVPGRHNAVNAAGAVAVLVALGVDAADAVRGVSAFGGTKRRFELHGTVDGVSVYDDYAHHPTEVAAALQAARTVVGDGRIIAVHQPHLYSRTAMFAGEFATVLERDADHTVVIALDGAREDPVEGVTGALVVDRFADPQSVDYEPDWADAAGRVAQIARPGDFVITLGCGSVYRIVPALLAALGDRAAQAAPVPAG